ncbi:MAG: chaperone modulator CbpM [Pelobium sp.]
MRTENLIPIATLCTHYKVEMSFISELKEIGLLELEIIEQTVYIHQDKISELEKLIRLHHELDVNLEGIDVIFNLLNKMEILQIELNKVKSRLGIYE